MSKLKKKKKGSGQEGTHKRKKDSARNTLGIGWKTSARYFLEGNNQKEEVEGMKKKKSLKSCFLLKL